MVSLRPQRSGCATVDSSCAEITSWPHSPGQPMALTTGFSVAGLVSGLHKAGLNPLHYRSGRSSVAAHPGTGAWRRRPLPRDRAERGDHR
jgi:hypothetical protein